METDNLSFHLPSVQLRFILAGEFNCSVALRAPERRVARSASPDLSDRALIRAAEQNRSSRSPSDLASKLANPIPNRSTRRYA